MCVCVCVIFHHIFLQNPLLYTDTGWKTYFDHSGTLIYLWFDEVKHETINIRKIETLPFRRQTAAKQYFKLVEMREA